jgi:hypothetical protein
MAQNIARLGVVLGLSTAEFTQGLGKATLKLSEFVDKAKPAILGVATAMTALIAKTVAYADEITDIADANDIAVSSVMALGTALAVSGGKAENAGKMLSSFSSKIDNAAQGNEEAQKTFQRLGVSLADIANSTNEQLLDKVVQKLASMKDPITRNAVKAVVSSLMNDLVAKRGITDYLVVCDGTNNTADRITRNELYVDVAIQPTKDVEFIYIPIRLKNPGEIQGGNIASATAVGTGA